MVVLLVEVGRRLGGRDPLSVRTLNVLDEDGSLLQRWNALRVRDFAAAERIPAAAPACRPRAAKFFRGTAQNVIDVHGAETTPSSSLCTVPPRRALPRAAAGAGVELSLGYYM